MTTPRLLAWACAVIAAAVLSTGCSPAGHRQPDIRSEVRQGFTAQDKADYQRRHDVYLTRCMRGSGFRYVPYHQTSFQEQVGLSDQAFAARYGFGISTLIDREVQAENSDPNAAIRSALAPPAQARYDRRLADCEDGAWESLGPPPDIVVVPDASDDGYLDVPRRAEADPRVTEAKRRYAECMRTKGFAAGSGETLRGDIRRRSEPFRRAYVAALDLRGTGDDTAPPVEEILAPEEVSALRALQEYELTAAAADGECGRHLYTVVDEVHAEYLEEYLDGE